jgi:hypothetical protein
MNARAWICSLGCVVVALVTMAPTPADAQTVANGPYYAVPSWDQTLSVNTRFIVLANMNSAAVLDRETGLVWERAASNTPVTSLLTNWQGALDYCLKRTTGGRLGWRLPTVQEFGTLFDPTTLDLPAGHPFNLVSTFYWTATTSLAIPTQAWNIRPGGFGESIYVGGEKANASSGAWCVRGGQSLDAQ